MRWLCCNPRPEYGYGILAGLAQIGEEVRIAPLRRSGPPQAEKLQKIITAYRPDVVFTPGWAHDVMDPIVLGEVMARSGLPHVYWATEDPTFHQEVSLRFAAFSSLVLTTTEECLSPYRRLGLATGLLLFGCNPAFHRPHPVDPWLQRAVVLVANNYLAFGHRHPARQETTERMLLPLLEAGLAVSIWGQWWDDAQSPFSIDPRHLAGPLAYRHLPRVYAAADIALGLQFDTTSRTQTSCRPFEVLSTGAFHLAPHTRATAALFKNGHHLAMSSSAGETVELALYYLNHPSERRRVAQQGRAYVMAEHNYALRAQQLRDQVRRAGLV